MFYQVYVSAAVRLFSRADLIALLEKSRVKNRTLGLTGMLLYKDGNFMQVLEGEQGEVQRMIATIEADPRHHHVLHLLRGDTEQRTFPNWSMGFRDLNAPDVHDLDGYSEFLNTPLTGGEFASDPAKAQRLLLTFKRSM